MKIINLLNLCQDDSKLFNGIFSPVLRGSVRTYTITASKDKFTNVSIENAVITGAGEDYHL